MIISYPTKIAWQKPLQEDLLSFFSKSTRKQLQKLLAQVENSEITYQTAPVSESFLDWFVPIYKADMSTKQNTLEIDIKNHIQSRSVPYFSLTILEKDIPVGAAIFSERKSSISIAFRSFNRSWSDSTIQSTPSYYGEYLFGLEAAARKKDKIAHGYDRNPYGINAGIGLGIYKLSIGCHAYLSKTTAFANLDTDTIDTDALILVQPEHGVKKITRGVLFCKPENEQKYIQATKFADQVSIEIIHR